MSGTPIGKGDTVRIATRALSDVKKVHPFVNGTDDLVVTRVDRGRGKTCLFLRRPTDNSLYLLWPEQVEFVRRAPPPARGQQRRARP